MRAVGTLYTPTPSTGCPRRRSRNFAALVFGAAPPCTGSATLLDSGCAAAMNPAAVNPLALINSRRFFFVIRSSLRRPAFCARSPTVEQANSSGVDVLLHDNSAIQAVQILRVVDVGASMPRWLKSQPLDDDDTHIIRGRCKVQCIRFDGLKNFSSTTLLHRANRPLQPMRKIRIGPSCMFDEPIGVEQQDVTPAHQTPFVQFILVFKTERALRAAA